MIGFNAAACAELFMHIGEAIVLGSRAARAFAVCKALNGLSVEARTMTRFGKLDELYCLRFSARNRQAGGYKIKIQDWVSYDWYLKRVQHSL